MRKDLLRDGEVISGALLAGLGAYILIEARQWGYYASTGPGPGFLPSIYGVAMVALSLLMILNRIRGRAQTLQTIDWPATRRALFTWTVFVIAAALLKPLGFVLSFALLTFVIVAFVFRRSPLNAAATAALTAIAFYLTFPVALGVALPTGWLGF